jgi:hypothetical protein
VAALTSVQPSRPLRAASNVESFEHARDRLILVLLGLEGVLAGCLAAGLFAAHEFLGLFT